MYQTLTFYHSLVRWLVVITLLVSIYRAFKGYRSKAIFSKTENAVRHWTATVAHIQLVIGIIIYTQSPVIKAHTTDGIFFRIIHPLLMLIAIIIITIGSAITKRKPTDTEKFNTMLLWFTIAFITIIIAIPWPFSPFANRPYFR